MIPKIIHYCWFGGGEMSPLEKKCMESWRTRLPGFEIKEWNETNFDVNSVQFTREAYARKKWAFVSDYVRLYALKQDGGIYLDTDVEVLKTLDEFLDLSAFVGYETTDYCQTGLIASEKSGLLVEDFLKAYENKPFVLSDGRLNTIANVDYLTKIVNAHNIKLDGRAKDIPGYLRIYPKDFFCPKRHEDGKIILTENSYTIHHFAGSWLTKREKFAKFVGQHTHPMAEYWIKYFTRNPEEIYKSLKAALNRRMKK